MSSWWQKKLLRYGLRYALERTGLLEEKALDLDSLDISIGKQNIVELKDIGLNIEQITKLAQLPPCLRLETARVLSLRLTIPADFYQSSIVVDVDGVNLVLQLQEQDVPIHQPHPRPAQRNRSPASTRTPQHRKTNRRIPSPPLYHLRGSSDPDNSLYIPTTQEVARSFLREEPLQELRELEASVAANAANLEESFVSESSEGEDVGTGTGIGVPAFLAGFLQGIVDRFKLNIKNVQLRMETAIPGDGSQDMPLALQVKVGHAEVTSVSPAIDENAERKRAISLHNIAIALMSEGTILTDLSEVHLQSSRATVDSQLGSPPRIGIVDSDQEEQAPLYTLGSTSGSPSLAAMSPTLPEPEASPQSSRIQDSVASVDADQFADAGTEVLHSGLTQSAELDIRPGEDNISWGSRRSQTSGPTDDDLWRSMVSEDDLPGSLIIEPERTPTPRALSSRSSSPFALRQRRTVSPYDRGTSSPGSWPLVDQTPEAIEHAEIISSRSNLECSERGNDHIPGMSSEMTDNKRHALEQTSDNQVAPKTPPEPEGPIDDSMMESKMFSHEDAESIYMSAYSGSPSLPVPGEWGSDPPPPPQNVDLHGLRNISYMDDTLCSTEHRADRSEPATPRAQTPERRSNPQSTLAQDQTWEIKQVLHIDAVCVSIPSSAASEDEVGREAHPVSQLPTRAGAKTGLPGTFSAYSEISSSRLRGFESVYREPSVLHSSPENPTSSHIQPRVDITLGTVLAQIDIATGRLLYALSTKVTSIFGSDKNTSSTKPSNLPTSSASPPTQEHVISAHMECFQLSLRAHIPSGLQGPPIEADGFTMRFTGASVKSSGETSIRLRTFAMLLGGTGFLSLENDSDDLASSQKLAPDSPVLAVNVIQRHTTNRRPVSEISVQTACLRLQVDLSVIDETFASFGGLSGILELSNSLLAESGSSSPRAPKSSKGVRFAGDSDINKPEIKFNGRLAGVVAELHGPQCSIHLKTTTTKAVYREHGIVATVEHILLSGPYLAGSKKDAALSVELTTLRVEYLLTPQDKDLERLLSLLTPSKDRYDNDDDILIETLLRQRRKGSLLRTVLGGVKVKIDEWDCISALVELGNDLSKISAVTKYLPEDDRPGLLALVRITNAEARLPVNERFGKLRVAMQDIHLAHVGIPSLLAFSIGGVHALKLDDQTPLIRCMLPLTGAENSPAIMARMLGDEEEPTIKIKLFNICAEYSVPVILALTDVEKSKEPLELANALANSVAELASITQTPKVQRAAESDMSKMAKKRTIVDLLVHDSAIGLTPRQLPSKALIVLSDVHASTKVPPENTVSAQIELRKVSIHLTDGNLGDTDDRDIAPATRHRVGPALAQQGYVSVGTLMGAVVGFKIEEDAQSGNKNIEVDVKNELFLLETCADSFSTLAATLGDLAPPTPPNTEPKYLLQPIAIEDMLNSFSGEAVPKPETQAAPQLLFDAEQAEEEFDDTVSEMPLYASMGPSLLEEEPDELLAESAMAGSLYGPISGMFDMEEDAENQSVIDDDYPETAESLLEDDPFEMTIAPDERLGDAALMRDLARQCKPVVDEKPIELGLYEIDELGYGEITGGPQALGSSHRFNAPYVTARRGPNAKQVQQLPFKLRVRDFSLIWHLHDGYDWQRTRDEFSQAFERVEQKAEERRARRRVSRIEEDEEESVIGDFLFNSIYIGIPTAQDAQDLRRQINRNIDEDVSETASVPVSGMSRPTVYSASGQPRPRQRRRLKVGRSKSHKISFDLKGVSADVLLYPPGSGEMVSSVDLRLKVFEIYDLVPTSTWRKFLTHMTSDPSEREMAKPMFHIQLDTVKTLESHAASEFLLHVAVLPLRLHVDQDALDFITRFFEFKDESMMLPEQPEGEKPFIQRVEIETVDLCLDYKPKKLDYVGLRSGKTTEFMNIITLEGANIQLKHLIRYGVNGFDQLHPVLNDLWMSEVKRTQLPTILAGLAPMRSLVNLGSGVRDVIAIPLREYKKDGRIVRSIQKGAYHFGKTTTSELARLGAKVALGTQTLLSNAEELLSPSDAAGPSRRGVGRRVSGEAWHDVALVSEDEEAERRPAVSAYANQPLGLLSGLKSARRYLEHDLLTARDALIAVQGEFLASRGPGDLAGAVARHAPTVILRPVIGATRAVGTTLLGVGNQIDRGYLRKVDDVSVGRQTIGWEMFVLTYFTEIQTPLNTTRKR